MSNETEIKTEKAPMVYCENLVKLYKIGDIEVMALQGLDLQVEEGEMLAIIGNSGSGKSTLMNIIGGLDRPTAGKILVNGNDLLKFTDKEMMFKAGSAQLQPVAQKYLNDNYVISLLAPEKFITI